MSQIDELIQTLDTALFRALAEPARLELLRQLLSLGGSSNVTTLASKVSLDTSVVSRHLKDMAQAQILIVERRGRERWYSINGRHLLERFELMTTLMSQVIGDCC